MVVTAKASVLFDGSVRGELLKLRAPICFWGGVDPATGLISDPKHPDHELFVAGKILAVPRIVGSSSSSQILLELLYKKNAPLALILGEADAIIGMAVLVGREMGFGTIPILHGKLDDLNSGSILRIDYGGFITQENDG